MINGELIVDNFAGGGGASTGIELATCINGEIEMEQLAQAGILRHTMFAIIVMIIPFYVFLHNSGIYFGRTLGIITGHVLGYVILCMHEERLFLVTASGVTIIYVIFYYSVMRIFIFLIRRILKHIVKKQRGTYFRALCSVEDVIYDVTFTMKGDKKYHISDMKEVECAEERPWNGMEKTLEEK